MPPLSLPQVLVLSFTTIIGLMIGTFYFVLGTGAGALDVELAVSPIPWAGLLWPCAACAAKPWLRWCAVPRRPCQVSVSALACT